MDEIEKPIVTEADVLAGSKEVRVMTRGDVEKKIKVRAMNWRTAMKATFADTGQAMIFMLENCVPQESQKLLDEIIPLHLVWLTNVATQLTNGLDALKKANAALTPKAAATDTPSSSPSSAS